MKIKPQLLTLLFALFFLGIACKKDKEDKNFLRAGINGANWEAQSIQVLTTGILPENDPVEIIATRNGQQIALRFNSPEPGSYSFRPGNNQDVLPATLLFFRVSYFESGHKIEWTTGQETDTRDFIIEISTDGVNFTSLDTVAANGVGSDYTYIVTDVSGADRYYYRLKQVDQNDQFSYSAVVSINNSASPAYYQPDNDLPRMGYDGVLQITSLDRSNRLMQGNFSFTVKAADGTEYRLTNGQFRFYY